MDWAQDRALRIAERLGGAPRVSLDDMASVQNDVLAQAPTPTSKKFMQERFIALRGQLSREAATFEATSRIANNTDIAKNSIDTARTLQGSTTKAHG